MTAGQAAASCRLAAASPNKEQELGMPECRDDVCRRRGPYAARVHPVDQPAAEVAFSKSGHRSQFSGVHQPEWVSLRAECHFPTLGIEASSVFELEDMGIVDDTAIILK